jgi:DNA repair protein SbcC/Rad50
VRPLHLQVKSFTSFRDEQQIDFTDLDLFAIVGPTGSGKSSLLDAMTYALFGTVERVGRQVGQLVSQGQKRLAVTLEFAVGEHRFRVSRSTPAGSGGTKILVERWNGSEFVQAGEGADRVREANAMLREFVGLDYDAFTRAVLLPQGQFADFLVGEAKDRRDILTELLGLRLFERLAKRAGELRRDAGVQATTKSEFLDTNFDGVTSEAVAEARAAGKASRAREKAATKAEKQVREIAKRGERAQGEIRELIAASEEAAAFAGVARDVAEELGDLADRTKASQEAVHAATSAAAAAATGATAATDARTLAEGEWGGPADLAAQRVRAEALVQQRGRLAKEEKALAKLEAAAPKLAKALEAAESKVAKAGAAREKALVAVEAATQKLDRAQHANLVAAVRQGVKVGDPCPICGAPVAKLAAAKDAGDLDAARKGRDDAVARAEAADVTVRDEERARAHAVAERDRAASDLARTSEELAARRDELAEAEAMLAGALGEDAAGPAEALAVLDRRIRELQQLATAEGAAAAEAARADKARVAAERERDKLAGLVGEQRAALAAQQTSALLARAKKLGAAAPSPIPETQALPKEGPALAGAADALSSGMDALARTLAELAEQRSSERSTLVEQAGGALAELFDAQDLPDSLEEIVELVADGSRAAAAAAAAAEKESEQLTERLASARALADEVKTLRARAERFGALATELRADRIMEFLQMEALQVLAAGGSERLETLSEGRFRLAYEGDEFFVVDTWNGEDRRSARTLSGGESFLASLALALALSEQVQALAVTEKAPLESLFLDEGFGTLDPETLEVVVGAIEQLGGDGRMVGVITHVQELAIRLPTRIEVEKSPRGSRLSVAS